MEMFASYVHLWNDTSLGKLSDKKTETENLCFCKLKKFNDIGHG